MNDPERRNQPSASGFFRLEKCPGSFHLIQQARELGQAAFQSSADADRGTRIHAWVAGEPVQLTTEELDTTSQLQARADEQIRLIFQDEPYSELKEKRVWLQD